MAWLLYMCWFLAMLCWIGTVNTIIVTHTPIPIATFNPCAKGQSTTIDGMSLLSTIEACNAKH